MQGMGFTGYIAKATSSPLPSFSTDRAPMSKPPAHEPVARQRIIADLNATVAHLKNMRLNAVRRHHGLLHGGASDTTSWRA